MKKCFADCICPDFEAATALCGAVRRVVIARRSQKPAQVMFFGGDSDKSRPDFVVAAGWRDAYFCDLRAVGGGVFFRAFAATGRGSVRCCTSPVLPSYFPAGPLCLAAKQSGAGYGAEYCSGAVLASVVLFPSVLPDRDSLDVRSVGSRLPGTFVGGGDLCGRKGLRRSI